VDDLAYIDNNHNNGNNGQGGSDHNLEYALNFEDDIESEINNNNSNSFPSPIPNMQQNVNINNNSNDMSPEIQAQMNGIFNQPGFPFVENENFMQGMNNFSNNMNNINNNMIRGNRENTSPNNNTNNRQIFNVNMTNGIQNVTTLRSFNDPITGQRQTVVRRENTIRNPPAQREVQNSH